DIDEFAIKMLAEYEDKSFKSVSSGDLDLDEDTDSEDKELSEDDQALFDKMKEILLGKVTDVRRSKRLKSHTVCLTNEGEISIEMEKVLSMMPEKQGIQANKVLEINPNHDIFQSLKESFKQDDEKIKQYTNILYNQALLIEGLPIEDPLSYTNDVWAVLK